MCVCVCVCVCVSMSGFGFHYGPALKRCYLWFSRHFGLILQCFGYDTVLIVNSFRTFRRSLLPQSLGYSKNTDVLDYPEDEERSS